jgi:4-hydroxy-tetrahydrodipicolinate synthase
VKGIWSAVLTPIDVNYDPDAKRAVAYYRDLLANGIDGINLLGTTGEAMSFSRKQRIRLMEAVAEKIGPERVMCGTGASALGDAVALTRVAGELAFAAALVMPPFFYREAHDDGIVRWFHALLEKAPGAPPILLYNFPKMSGIAFHAGLVDRLLAEFPGKILGMKDSSNDETLQRELLARHAELRIFPSTEGRILESQAFGAAGIISGSVALWPRESQRAFSGDAEAAAYVKMQRDGLSGAPLIALVRDRVAAERSDDAWRRAMPPH